jgi:hypothetical protein
MRNLSRQPGVTDHKIDWLTIMLAIYSLVSIGAVIGFANW